MFVTAQGLRKVFFEFFDLVVTGVRGRRSWTTNIKISQTISGCQMVTISDEAYAELILLNYWDRWKSGGPTKWTDCRAGDILQHGWSGRAHIAFNDIYKWVQRPRGGSEEGEAAEKLFMDKARDEYSVTKRKRKVGGELLEELEVMVDDW
jgi:hypothetical protein